MIRIPLNDNAEELVLCQLPGLSCMGCCTAYKVQGRKATEKQLEINTKRFRRTKDPHQFSLDSGPTVARGSEICKTLIREGNTVFCPAHPKISHTKGKDMREFCCKGHWCVTMKAFRTWKKERQEAMIRFVLSQGHDWYSYSVANDTGKSLEEFLEYEMKNMNL